MKRLEKVLKVTAIVIAILAVAYYGLRIYAKHFYSQELQAEYFYLSELPLNASQFEDDFNEIHRTVMENYSLYQASYLSPSEGFALPHHRCPPERRRQQR